jgi:hypothetical protein
MTDPTSRGASALSQRAFVVATTVLLAWSAFTIVMIFRADAEGPQGEILWTRLAWLFSSVEAVAFGAAGAIFGSSIQRERAERAEQRAQENSEAATAGRALAQSIVVDEPSTQPPDPHLESYGAQGAPAANGIASRHAALARKLFPDL